VLAESAGKPLRIVPESIAAMTGRQIASDKAQPKLHFEALKRILDREEQGWRDID
jgi:hypothetical protein